MVEFGVQEGGRRGGIFVFFALHFGRRWWIGGDGLGLVYGFMVN